MLKHGQQGRLKIETMRNTPTKKAYLTFKDFFFCCRCGYIMHVSVYENCRIQSTSVWYKNHQGILNVIKVMTSYIQGPRQNGLMKRCPSGFVNIKLSSCFSSLDETSKY